MLSKKSEILQAAKPIIRQ